MLHSWFRDAPGDYEICAIQPPGREERFREAPIRRMSPLVSMAVEVMRPALDLPYALFGHSLGALTAFEVAREIRRQGLPEPVRLIASSRTAPQIPPLSSPIHQLAESEFLARLRDRYGPIPPVILGDPEMLALFLPVLRSDIEILETYFWSAEAPLQMPISVLAGSDDRMVDPEGLRAWCEQTSATSTVRILAGDHFYPRTAGREFLSAIRADIEAALPPRPASRAE